MDHQYEVNTIRQVSFEDFSPYQDERGVIKKEIRKYTVGEDREVQLPVEWDKKGRPTVTKDLTISIRAITKENFATYVKVCVYCAVGQRGSEIPQDAPIHLWYEHEVALGNVKTQHDIL